MPTPFIELQDLHKSFGKKQVLRGVSLTIHHGETIVILGGSGTGKSVILRHIIGLMRPDAGRVLIEGEDITDYGERQLIDVRKKIGMLFQAGALFDSMNVAENVGYSLAEHTDMTREEIAEKVKEKLGLVDLKDIETKMPSELSGGMKKRVALARSIALEPRSILYDEPTTGLDPITSNRINLLIRNIQKVLEVTSVVVTHDIVSCFTVADRIAFLSEGRVKFIGTADEAKRSKDEELRSFLTGEGGYDAIKLT
ncbi:MAG: ABC transporter ATP-binding protein [Acidobacteriota bacterium]